MIEDRIRFIGTEAVTFPQTVYVGFSGGKDSSAVVKLLYTAALRYKPDCRFVVVYCDTGVENPVIDRCVKSTLLALDREAQECRVDFRTKVIEPALDQSFFVRLIGRGYPPPTNSFRWCTKDVRIRPFQRFLNEIDGNVLIAIGTRVGESRQRDRSLKKSMDVDAGVSFYQKQREGFSRATLFTPIIDFDVADVWEALVSLESPKCISGEFLAQLYKDGSGECPTVRDFKDKPCSKSRFGCWTCTVVRRDKSAETLISRGYDELQPYLSFRQWLLDIRNQPTYRCRLRRNGATGPGPFNLIARKMILEKLDLLESETGEKVLTVEQRNRISELWTADMSSGQYLAIE